MLNWKTLQSGALELAPGMPGIDASLVWADATGFQDFRRADVPLASIRVLLEQRVLGLLPNELQYDLRSLSTPGLRTLLHAKPSAYRRVELQMPVICQRPRPALLQPESPNVEQAAPPRSTKHTLVGVIDGICPFAHLMLQPTKTAGSPLLAIWDQEPDRPAFDKVGGTRPIGFSGGVQIDRPALHKLLAKHRRPAASLDEAACYREAGQRDWQESFGHGAAVLGMLFDRRPGPQAATPPQPLDCDIVFVQLPQDVVQDASSASLSAHLLEGLRYIQACAGPETQRIIINISDGSSRGSHDGASIVEMAMHTLVETAEQGFAQKGSASLDLVLAAGNAYEDQRHAQIDRVGTATITLGLHVPPSNESPSFVNLRLAAGAAKGIQLRLLPPGTDPDKCGRKWTSIGQATGLYPDDQSMPVCGLVLGGGLDAEAIMGLIAFNPTQMAPGSERTASPSGLWRLQVRRRKSEKEPKREEADLHAWISRNQQNPGALPRSQQARFVDLDNSYDPKRHLRAAKCDMPHSLLRRSGTLNSIACLQHQRIHVVGSVAQQAWVQPDYVSAGPAAGPAHIAREGPDWSAALEPSLLDQRVILCGNLSGQWTQGAGSSFAVPRLVRAMVLKHPGQTAPPHRNKARVGRWVLP